jgi:predicted Zn-dependent protease
VALALAGCRDNVGIGACFEPDATPYPFALNGDSNLVFHWPSSYMPVRVYAEPTGALPTNVAKAMAVWAGAFRCGELTLAVATDSTHADIIVRNPPTIPAVERPATRVMHSDSSGACTGVTQFSLDSTGTALAGPMRSYVSPYPGNDSALVASCYHFVVAHELGHALGLLADSPDTGDLMSPSPYRLALSEADRYTIQLLYHTASTLGPPPRN